jgi:DnaK suppressor protein
MDRMKTYDASMAEQFRSALVQQAAQLRAALEADIRDAADNSEREVDDLNGVSARETEVWLADTQAAHASIELAEIRAAVARIRDGSYGLCMDCGEAIDVRRLLAMPAASCCASCQTLREEAVRERRA